MTRLLYKPVGLLVSVLAGILASGIFKKVWKLAAGGDEAPKATDAGQGSPKVLATAALQGANVAVVKAAAGRTAAAGTQKLTGTWPGDEGQREQAMSAG